MSLEKFLTSSASITAICSFIGTAAYFLVLRPLCIQDRMVNTINETNGSLKELKKTIEELNGNLAKTREDLSMLKTMVFAHEKAIDEIKEELNR